MIHDVPDVDFEKKGERGGSDKYPGHHTRGSAVCLAHVTLHRRGVTRLPGVAGQRQRVVTSSSTWNVV